MLGGEVVMLGRAVCAGDEEDGEATEIVEVAGEVVFGGALELATAGGSSF